MGKIIGILRETKNPPDRRVPITPRLAEKFRHDFPGVEVFAEPSEIRAFKDDEYEQAGFPLHKNIADADILFGVKEVAIPSLIEGKTYLFFSHTGKKQPHNQKLLQEMARLKITMIDYEYVTNQKNVRLVAFGRWAGIVGAYNGIMAYGMKHKLFNLKRAYTCFDRLEMQEQLDTLKLPNIKILVTGGGRVAGGAMETLAHLKLREVSAQEFLTQQFNEPVICRIDPDNYVKRKDGAAFDLQHFFSNPEAYESTFLPYTKVTDLYIPCHFWDPKSPVFMTREDMQAPDFKMKVIADVSCDLVDPIPSTLRPSKIADPVYGYNPFTGKEDDAYQEKNIMVMAIDNLPGELPRDASEDFACAVYEHLIPALVGEDKEGVVERATILKQGKLTPKFSYLKEYLEGN